MENFVFEWPDYLAFTLFFVGLSVIGYWAGRKERGGATDYFLAGKRLPWYVIGGSFVASNISSEHFIGMIGAAYVYGITVAMSEWGNVATFSLMIWFFIPFLLASKVFTIPEFLERRFNLGLRQAFAAVTVVSNVVAFLAAVLYGGGLALQGLFGWNLTAAIVILGFVAGIWAIYGGLSSVAWTDLFTVVVMVIGGITVTVFGLEALSEDGSLVDGFSNMIHANQAIESPYREAVDVAMPHMTEADTYNRLSVIQPADHPVMPWPSLIFMVFSISIWYNVLNQFMIQRVLGAKNMYHARMGIVFAGFMKVLLPLIVVVPGLILFAMKPEILAGPWDSVQESADKGYVSLIQQLVPVGLRGLFMAALFGAIQSTVNSVLNSTSTIITLDFYRRLIRPEATDRQLVRMGLISSTVVLIVAIVLARFIDNFGGGLFVYIQTLYAFFAPPFAAAFLLGIVWRRINSTGATVCVIFGFVLGIGMKLFCQFTQLAPAWLEPFANQAAINWACCTVICIVVSLLTQRPRPEQISDELTINWRRLNLLEQLGDRWYTSVITWWAIFVLLVVALMLIFSGLVF
jgi:solute:Na+ symporter, SSS family